MGNVINGTATLNLPESLMPKDSCARCAFVSFDGRELQCRRLPPSTHIVMVPAPPPRTGQMMPQQLVTFPTVTPEICCGEFKAGSKKLGT